jgi:8-oxo-dGTP diphosphatase
VERRVRRSGDGFVAVADGTMRWGRFGAAGLLLRHLDDNGDTWYFLARRAAVTHQGGTWAVPGGALDDGEEPIDGALREFREEIGDLVRAHRIVTVYRDDHGGWSYWTIVADVDHRFEVPTALSWETAEARWVRAEEVRTLELFGAFRESLVHLGI